MNRTATMPSIFRFMLLLLVAALVSGTQVYAQSPPPTFSKAFQPEEIGPGSSSTLVFTIENANPNPVTDLAFTDNLPAGMTVADGSNPTSSCGGTLTAPEGGSTITFSGGSMGAGATCTLSVNVTTSSDGVFTNTTGDLTSSAGNSGTASADLTVLLSRIGFSKSFSSTTLPSGSRTTLTFNLSNGGSQAFNIIFTDFLPTGVTFADPANFTTDCLGTLLPDEEGQSFTFAGGFLPAESSCTISVDVVGTGSGPRYNVTTNLTSSQGDSGKATATLTLSQTPLSIIKEFTDDPAPADGNATLQFTIRNANRGETATNISFSDDLDATLTGLVASGLPMNDVCGPGSQISGTDVIMLTGGTLDEGETCVIDVPLSIPSDAEDGFYPDTTSAVTAMVGGSPQTGNRAIDNLFIAPVPILTKTFQSDIASGGSTATVEFSITNTSTTSALTSASFTDNLTAFIGGTTPDGTYPRSGICDTGSLVILNNFPSTGEVTLQLQNGQVPAGETCDFTVDLNIPEGTTNGTYTNTTSEITGQVDGSPVTGAAASDDLSIVAAPNLTKEFIDDPVTPGSTVTLEFTLDLNENAPETATSISFTDDLDATLTGLMATGLPMTDVCGLGSTLTGTSTLTLSNGTLAPGESCTFSVTLDVPGDAELGLHTNTTSEVSALYEGSSVTSAPASDDLEIQALSGSKEFIDDPVFPGDQVTLQFSLSLDASSGTDATNISFTDDLDATLSGLEAIGLPANDVCGTGSQISGTSTLTLTGGNLAPGGSCMFSVTLQVPGGASPEDYGNVTSDIQYDAEGSTFTAPPVSDDLTIADPTALLQLSKEFTNDPVDAGGTVDLEFTIDFNGPNPATDISFTDDLDATLSGLVATGLPMNDVCGAGSQISGTSTLTLTGGSLAAGTSSCTFSVTLQVPGTATPSTYPNTTSDITAMSDGDPVTGDPATDNLIISDVPDVSATKTDAPFEIGGDGAINPGDTIEYTVEIANNGGRGATSVVFNDTPDANTMLVVGSVTTTQGSVTSGNSGGDTDVSVDIGTLDGGGSTVTVTFQVLINNPFPADAEQVCNQGTVSSPSIDTVSTGDPDATGTGDPEDETCTLVTADPDVSATKTDIVLVDDDNDSQADPGDTIRYTVVVSNDGDQDAAGAMFADTPDANTTLVVGSVTTTQGSVTSGNTGGDTDVSVDIGTVAGDGGSVTITFDVVVDDPFAVGVDEVSNQGTVTGDNFDEESTDDPDDPTSAEDPTVTPIDAASDLSITKSDDDVTAEPGDTVTYTIEYANNGDQNATGVTITDTVPEGTTFDAANSTVGWSCVPDTSAGSTCTFDVGALNGGGAGASIDFAVTVNNPFAAGVDEIENTVTIEDDGSNGDDPTPEDNTATDTTPVDADSDLSITKTDGDVTAEPGDTVTYTIDYANNGDQNATGVTITDTVPVGTTFDAANSTAGWSCVPDTSAGSTCTFDVGALDGGAGASIDFAVTVDNPIAAGIEEIENTVTIEDDGSNGDEPNTEDNTDTDTTPVDAEPDLAITKDDGDLTAQPGDIIPYTLTIANNGDQNATGVTITDTVPVGTTFDADASTAGWSCTDGDAAGTTCTFDVGALDGGGASTDITFAVAVDNPIAAGIEEIENTASVSDDGTNGTDPNTEDNTDSDTTPIQAAPNVSATKADVLLVDEDGDGQADPGDTIGYTIVVSNDGDQGVADVVVNDTVDDLLDLDCGSLTTSGTVVSCTPGPGGSFTVNLSEIDGEPSLLAPQATAQITFSASIVVPFPGTADEVANQAVVSYTGETGTEEILSDDPDTARPRDRTITPIDLAADLELTKTASTTTPNFGTEVVFTLTVTNQGPVGVVTGVEVRDVLPKGLTFVSAEGDGEYNPETGIWDLGGVAFGAPETIEITVTADALTPLTNKAEVLRADLPDPDSTPGDGTGDDYDAVTITPVAADLELSKRLVSRVESADGTTVTGTFSLTLTNDGPSDATGVEVMEFFAGEMTFVSASPTGAFNPATNTWTVGTLAAGSSTTLSITVMAPVDGPVFNLAEVSAVDQTDPDSEPLDGTGDDFAGAALNRNANVSFPALAADVSITKTVDQEQPILGEQISYTITVNNSGPFTTAGVAVTDLLPEGLSFISASASSDDEGCDPCTYDAETGIWTVGKLVDGETATLVIVVEVTTEGQIVNTARLTSNYLPDPDSDISNDNLDEDDVATATASVASGKATSVVRSGGEGIPETFEMGQNYPNPFNPQTTIPFGVPQASRVVVEVYNLLGQRVAVLMDGELPAGRHEVIWQALDQPTGMYLVRLVAGEKTLTKRITLVK